MKRFFVDRFCLFSLLLFFYGGVDLDVWSAQAVVTGGIGRAGIRHMVLEVERAKT